MACILLSWTRRDRLSAEEVEAGARQEATRRLALDPIERGELTRSQDDPERHVRGRDRTLELHLAADAKDRDRADTAPSAKSLADLPLPGPRPLVLPAGAR